METIDIKGKEYVQVHERVKEFRRLHPGGSIVTTLLENAEGWCVFKAEISVEGEGSAIVATGHAREKEGDSFINKTSYLENCETSAIGRALGCLGIGIDASMASADEVGNAQQQQSSNRTVPLKEERAATKPNNKAFFKERLVAAVKTHNIRLNLKDADTVKAVVRQYYDMEELKKFCLATKSSPLPTFEAFLADENHDGWAFLADYLDKGVLKAKIEAALKSMVEVGR